MMTWRAIVWAILALFLFAQFPFFMILMPPYPVYDMEDLPDLDHERNYLPEETDPELEMMKLSWENFTKKEYISDLNIDPTQVRYFTNISETFEPTQTQWDLIVKNGFVVVDMNEKSTIVEAYEYYWKEDLPVFITTDTVLHTFHLLFDQFLQDAEKDTLGPLLENITSDLLQESDQIYNVMTNETLKEGMRDVVVFFGVPAVLLDTGDTIPAYAEEEVNGYVEKIVNASETEEYPGQDYTQYKPRGHYADDPYLQMYFRAMMWYGRKSYDMNKTADVLRTCLITSIFLSDPDARSAWDIMYEITTYLIGESDSLNQYDIAKAMTEALGAVDINLLADPLNVGKVKTELEKDEYKRQKILSEVVYKEGDDGKPMIFPKIFQFMGQRYVPDSDIMQNVMYDRVPLYNNERRGLPSSLDVMAVIGSPRAVHNLKDELEFYNYTEQLKDAWASVQLKDEEYWEQSIYFGVLRSYKELISGQEDERYQDFMRTAAWADEKLNTAGGNYAELKHDTILYAKQPYSPGIVCGTPDGMVEPYPKFYSRMRNISLAMKDIVTTYFDPESSVRQRFSKVFSVFADANKNLTEISIHELEGVSLTFMENYFIRTIYYESPLGCDRIPDGWLVNLIDDANVSANTQDTRLIADIATDSGTLLPKPSPPRVLSIADGYVRTLIVVYEKPDGELYFLVGPVYSFYEFALEGFTRLNDDEWVDLLDSVNRPDNPFWISTFYA